MRSIPKYVLSSDGKERGKTTGGTRSCQLEGCTGIRIHVRWAGGQYTWPCSKGMKEIDQDTWQIE